MPALDALTTRMEFLDQVHEPGWMQYMDGYAASCRGEAGDAMASEFWSIDITGQQISKRLMHNAQMAHNYYITPTMQVLVTAASHDWAEDEPVREDDFPQPHGWLWIPGGVTIVDIRGRVMATSVIMWHCHGTGVDIHFFSDKYHPSESMRRTRPDIWARLPRLTPWDHHPQPFGEPVPRALVMGKAVPPEISDQIKVITGPEGQLGWYLPEGWSPEDMQPHSEPHPVLCWLISCLRIMQQPLARLETEGMPANIRKKYQHKIKMRNTLVTVIDYRRTEGEYEHGTGRTLTHRYFRRGHWRQQAFKNEEGEWDHKRIRIQPQIVGDPSLPLMLREHVNQLKR